LAHIDILALNRAEADVLVPLLVARFGAGRASPALESSTAAPRLLRQGVSGGGHELALASFLAGLNKLGPRYVVVTDGRHGAFVGTPEAILYCPVIECTVAGTAGAGDAFSATFAALLALGRCPEEALRAATINAASVVGHVDTQSGLLTRAALEERLPRSADDLKIRSWTL